MEVNANIFAYLALFLSVPITLFFFSRYPAPRAAGLSILGAAMFLPEALEIDLPLLPPLNKISIPAFAALIGAFIWARERTIRARPFRGADVFFVLLVCGTVGTVMTNSDPVPYEAGALAGLSTYDIIAGTIRDLLNVFALFFLGRALYNTRRDLYTFATLMVMCGSVYGVLAMIEVRFSPQLHNWIYGYHQHSFLQHIRFGGYRPMLFMTHGLNASRFMLACLLCAAALLRADRKVWNVSAKVWVVYLAFIIVISKSAGAWVFAAIGVPLVLFTSARMQIRFALLLSSFVLLYPILRSADQVPVDAVLEWASENVGSERASSLEDRFEQEDAVLEKMNQRRVFGWGGGGRYNVYDPRIKLMSVIDGEWLHVYGSRGMFGFLCLFGLNLLPVWTAWRTVDRLRPRDARLVAGLTVMMAVLTFDNIPNSTGTLPQLFMAGVVYGATRGLALQTAAENRAQRAAAGQHARAAHPGALGEGSG